MRSEWIKKAAAALLAALLLELIPCQFSFWTTVTKKTEDLTARVEILAGYTAIEELDQDVANDAAAADSGEDVADSAATAAGDQTTEGGSALYLLDGSYLDDAGYLHVPDGSLTLRVKNYKGSLQRIFLNLDFLYNQPVLAEVFARDEGNSYPYSLGDGRILLQSVPENRYLKVYPYGQVSDFYIRIQTADASGNAAAGSYGELVVKYHGLSANGTIPFHFRAGRFVVLWAAVFGMLLLKKDSRLHQISFDAQDARGRQKRFVVVLGFTAILLAGAFFSVRINPACRQNLAVHHAQYQELAEALSEGKVSVGDAEEALLAMKNPYDTIALQAAGIGYRADYAYHNGKYYVYFGIVPVLLLYLPYYLLTGGALQNYVAVFVFFAGFIIAAAGFVYELMKRYFKEQPFYLWAVGIGMLVGSYSMFYLLIRPDLYHVPIVASAMFATGGLWLYLAGLNRPKKAVGLYAFGSFCMALTAGCRPQFILFAALAVVLFWERVFVKRELFSKKGWRQTAALVVPYVLIAAGLMAYNALRFGSPFDFGASYSMTSNDMTHRGTNLERILYGIWYFLFEPMQLEGKFPYLQSASIATDYLGKLVTESWFGGIFACSMLTWGIFLLGRLKKNGVLSKELTWFCCVSLAAALVIGCVDANGAGILIRYGCDVSFGIFLAAVVAVLGAAKAARQKKVYGLYVAWLKAAIFFQAAVLFLILVNKDGSINLQTGNPALYETIRAALRF